MIPYDELCESLARFRTRNGMANGPSASPQRAQAGVSPQASVSPPMGTARAASGDYPAQRSPSGEFPAAQRSPSGGYPAAPAFVSAATREDYVGGPDADDRTDIHTPAAPPREDPTGEIDIDTVDVVEEDDV